MKRNEWAFESHIGFNRSWWSYYVQYRKVVRDIAESIQNGTNSIDGISLPLLFSIRHCVELGLKANILEFEKLNNKILKLKLNGKGSHSLEMLYNRFIDHLKAYKNKYPLSIELEDQLKEYLSKFETLKDRLHKLDQNSFNFRYPVDTNGKYNFTWTIKENLMDIIKAFNYIDPLLISTCDVLLPKLSNQD